MRYRRNQALAEKADTHAVYQLNPLVGAARAEFWHGRVAQFMLMKFGFRLGLFTRVSTAVADFSE